MAVRDRLIRVYVFCLSIMSGWEMKIVLLFLFFTCSRKMLYAHLGADIAAVNIFYHFEPKQIYLLISLGSSSSSLEFRR